MRRAILSIPGLGTRMALAAQRISWRVPEWWVGIAVLATWGAMITAAPSTQVATAAVGHVHHAATALITPAVVITEISYVIAMMVPLLLPTLRRVALASLWSRRDRAVFACLAGFLAVWIAAALALGVLTGVVRVWLGPVLTIVLAVAVALIWQRTETKRVALRGCHLLRPLAPSGWRADRDCLHLGIAVGSRCVLSCWALMAVVSAADHQVLVLVGVLGVMVIERFGRHALHDTASAIVAELRFAVASARTASRASSAHG